LTAVVALLAAESILLSVAGLAVLVLHRARLE
jgi:hypothetical protein